MNIWKKSNKTSEIAQVGDTIIDYAGRETVVIHVSRDGAACGDRSVSPLGTYKIVKHADKIAEIGDLIKITGKRSRDGLKLGHYLKVRYATDSRVYAYDHHSEWGIAHDDYVIVKRADEVAGAGDTIKIVANTSFHRFAIGEVVTVKETTNEHFLGVTAVNAGEKWYVRHDDYTIVKRAPAQFANTESKQETPCETFDSYRLVDTLRVTRRIPHTFALDPSRSGDVIDLERKESEYQMNRLRAERSMEVDADRLMFGTTTWRFDYAESLRESRHVVYQLEMPIYEKYQRHTDFRSLPTRDLVEELIKREGVVEYDVPTPDHAYRVQSLDTSVDGSTWRTLGPSIGPARVLVVTD